MIAASQLLCAGWAWLRRAACLYVVLFIQPNVLAAQVRAESSSDFVGSAVCKECHGAEHDDWLSSHHAAAMQKPGEKSVLGRFDGAIFRKGDVETIFYKKSDKFYIRTNGPDGKLADYEIAYVFGAYPLQQYLIALPGGRLQAFGVAWDARPASESGQRWFDLYPDRMLSAGDPLHWTGVDQNWNYQCAWCHSTNLRKNYDPVLASFKTTWSELSVGCEACHGAAANHLDWARSPQGVTPPAHGFTIAFDERNQATWRMGAKGQATRATPRVTSKEIQICAGCHSRRGQFSDDPADTAQFFDAFRPSTLEPGLYHLDGQQRDEVYNYASFLQSRMHAAGVTCSDCHNPHSGKTRATGNAVCAQCHAPERFDQAAHYHHVTGSTGAQCANCHMPTTTYMGVHARHDHSMRIPRPDRSIMLKAPNACNQCHLDKTANWAAETVKAWFPSSKLGAQTFAEAFAHGELDGVGAREELSRIASDVAQAAIVRASALRRLTTLRASEAAAAASSLVADPDPNVRAAAVAALANADPKMRATLLAPVLRDETRLVRMDAARALAGVAERELSARDREAFDKALAEYVTAQMFNAERAESRANLGALYLSRGDMEAARAEFSKAIALDQSFVPAAIGLAEMLRAGGDETGAETALRESLVKNPNAGAIIHALGLSLIRQGRAAEAMDKLAEAPRLAPDETRYAYVYAVALHDIGRTTQAIEILRNAIARRPNDRDILLALASYELEAGDAVSAQARAKLLTQLEPNDPEIILFLRQILRQSE